MARVAGAAARWLLGMCALLLVAGCAAELAVQSEIALIQAPRADDKAPAPLRGIQRTLLQTPTTSVAYTPSPSSSPPTDQQSSPSPSDQQQSPAQQTSPQPGSNPSTLPTTPSPTQNNTKANSSKSSGLSPTAKKAAIIGTIVGIVILVAIAVAVYVWCVRGNSLKAPPLVAAAYGKTDYPHAPGANFDLMITDTSQPSDGAARMMPVKVVHHEAGTRGVPPETITIRPPSSWQMDPTHVGAGAGGLAAGAAAVAAARRGRSSANSSMENVLGGRGQSQSLLSIESTASMSSLQTADARSPTHSAFSSAPSSASAMQRAAGVPAATSTGMHRTSTYASESLPATSMQPPRLPAMPISLAHGGAGGGAMALPGGRGMMGGGGGRGTGGPVGSGPDPLMAVMGYGALVVCTTLAREILEAGDRVVANHARCRRIVTRVRLMQPLLLRLQKVLQGPKAPTDIEPMLEHIQEVYGDCRTTVLKWCDNSGSWVQVVKNMVRSRAFQDEFVDLNERLSNCYSDLTLALNISQTDVAAGARTIEPKDAEEDLKEDLRELASELMSRGWGELEPEEQALVKELYAQHGLDLDQLLKQAKKVWQEDKIKDLRVPWSQLQILEEVGSGGYGTVFRARWAGSEVAVKKLSATAVTERVRKELEREAYIMSTLFHPNVARFYGVVVEHPNYALVMQYYSHGTLLQLLQHDSTDLPWQQRYRLAHDIAQGMRYLHSRPVEAIVHGDLKSSNLLIDAEGRVVITDFGLAKVKTTTKTIAPGAGGVSACYCAPELLNAVAVRRTPACDVYSYGMILFEIATREIPFDGLDINLIYNHVRRGVRPDIPESIPQAFAELTRWCWAQKPTDRPTFDQIVDRLNGFLDASPLE